MSKKNPKKLFLGFFGATIDPKNFREICVENHTEGLFFKKSSYRFWLKCNDRSCYITEIKKNSLFIEADIEAFNNCLLLLHNSGVNIDYTKFKALNGTIG